MNALLGLEPRMAGDVIREPDIEFPGYQGDMHYAAERPNFCPTELGTICTSTLACIDSRICG